MALVLRELTARARPRQRSRSRCGRCRRACSPAHLVNGLEPGTIVRLALPEGDFVLPDPPPQRMLFLVGGSGITPVIAMLRTLDRRGTMPDVVMHYSSPTEDRMIFRDELDGLEEKHDGSPSTSCTPTPTACSTSRTSTRSAPTGGSARPTPAGPGRCSTPSPSTSRRRPGGPAAPRAVLPPARWRGRRGRHDHVPQLRQDHRRRRRDHRPRGRRGGRHRDALRLPDGHLPHLHAHPRRRQRCATCATATSTTTPTNPSRPASPPLSVTARSTSELDQERATTWPSRT